MDIIKAFIDASRVEGDLFVPSIREFPLIKVMKDSLSAHHAQAEMKDQHFSTDLKPLKGKIMTSDESHLMCVIDNLVGNTIKYTPQGGSIDVSFTCDESHLTAIIKDSGPGIHEDEIELLFKKFTRLKNKPTGGESSTGLGLFTVRKIVKGLGGSIQVKSKVGSGSTFTLELPLEHKKI